jgi:hypothetical protein
MGKSQIIGSICQLCSQKGFQTADPISSLRCDACRFMDDQSSVGIPKDFDLAIDSSDS